MHAESTQIIFRCKLCDKPFNIESTLKRHGYYCRARKSGVVARKRSCVACAKAKARCDGGRPVCARCIDKRLQCLYHGTATEPAPKKHQVQTAEVQPTELRPLGSRQFLNRDGSPLQAEDLFDANTSMLAFEDDPSSWTNPNIDFLSPWSKDVPQASSAELFAFEQVLSTIDQVEPITPPNALPSPILPPYPSDNVRWLIERPKLKTNAGPQGTISLIQGVLKSYPLMMLRHGNTPPFLHAYLISPENDMDSMEPIHNCMSLMHMIGHNGKGSRKLFWRNVRTECEQWLAEYMTFDRWKLLVVMQAVLIYILFRVQEGETDENNLDHLLLAVVVTLAKHLSQPRLTYSNNAFQNTSRSKNPWIEWIFEESARRICVIYRIINMILYFEPALLCELQDNLIMAPLPSKQYLWEAPNEMSWTREKNRSVDPVYGLAGNGDLVNITSGGVHCHNPALRGDALSLGSISCKKANWEEWGTGMDSFGSLVMLAAALVSYTA